MRQPRLRWTSELIAAITVATLTHRAHRRREAAPAMRSYWPGSLLYASRWVGAGLGIAGLTGLGAWAFGRPFLTSAHGHPTVALLGELPLASAALFDLGVYITVVGASLLMLSVLGAASKERAKA